MRRGHIHALSFVLSCGILIVAAVPVLAQSVAASPGAKADLRDFNGVWSPLGSSIPNNDITDHMLPGQEISFTPYGAERYRTIDHSKDATNTCGPAGYMRGIQTPLMPFQIVQNPKIMSINMEYMYSFRLVYTDGSKHPADIMDYPEWMGHSVGHWEGDTLVVDAIGFKEKTWLDTNGLEHSEKLHMIERFQKTNPNTIRWTVTVEDPVFFAHSFTYAFDFKRQNTRILSYDCGENEKDAAYMKPTLGGTHHNKKVLKFPN
jgi:hypothetical protein